MANYDDTIRLQPTPPPSREPGRSSYSVLPEDTIGGRMGVAVAVSLGINFLVLYSASFLINRMTITPPPQDINVRHDVRVELREKPTPTPAVATLAPISTPTPQRTVNPTPTPRVEISPSPEPSATPSATPTASPSPEPTVKPSVEPTATPKSSAVTPTPIPDAAQPHDSNSAAAAPELASSGAKAATGGGAATAHADLPAPTDPTNPNRDKRLMASAANPASKVTTGRFAANAKVSSTPNPAADPAANDSRGGTPSDRLATRPSNTNATGGVAGGRPTSDSADVNAPGGGAAMGRTDTRLSANPMTGSAAGRSLSVSGAHSANVGGPVDAGASVPRGSGAVATLVARDSGSAAGGPAGSVTTADVGRIAVESDGGPAQGSKVVSGRTSTGAGRVAVITMNNAAASVTNAPVVESSGAVRAGSGRMQGRSADAPTAGSITGATSSGPANLAVDAPGTARGTASLRGASGGVGGPANKLPGTGVAALGGPKAGSTTGAAESGPEGGPRNAGPGGRLVSRSSGPGVGPGSSGEARGAQAQINEGGGPGGGIGGRSVGAVGPGTGTGSKGRQGGGPDGGDVKGGGTGTGPLEAGSGNPRSSGNGTLAGKGGTGGTGTGPAGNGTGATGQANISGEGGNGVERSGSGTPVKGNPADSNAGTIKESDKPARLRSSTSITIPENMRDKEFSRTVKAHITVPAVGRIKVEITQGSGSDAVDRYVAGVIARWQFERAMRNGKPVDDTIPVSITLTVN